MECRRSVVMEHGFPRAGSREEWPLAAACSGVRRAGLQRQRVQLADHLGLERLVDDLVLLDSGFAAKRFGYHSRGIMIAVAGEIADRHLGVRNARPDQAFDIVRCHSHGASPRGATLCRRSAGLADRRRTAKVCGPFAPWTACKPPCMFRRKT